MKKLLFTIMFSALTLTINAQELKVNTQRSETSTRNSRIKYQGEVSIGYSVGVGENALTLSEKSISITAAKNRMNLHTVQGVRFNKYVSTGIGIGLDYYTDSNIDLIAIPIYLNAKGYLPIGKNLELFLSFDIGGSIGIVKETENSNGLFLSPSVGIDYKNFYFSLGYNYQALSDSYDGFKSTIKLGAISFKVGYFF